MTKKDYELIADVIKTNFDAFKALDVHPSHWQGLLSGELSRAFAKDNAKFDSYKFAKACGMKD